MTSAPSVPLQTMFPKAEPSTSAPPSPLQKEPLDPHMADQKFVDIIQTYMLELTEEFVNEMPTLKAYYLLHWGEEKDHVFILSRTPYDDLFDFKDSLEARKLWDALRVYEELTTMLTNAGQADMFQLPPEAHTTILHMPAALWYDEWVQSGRTTIAEESTKLRVMLEKAIKMFLIDAWRHLGHRVWTAEENQPWLWKRLHAGRLWREWDEWCKSEFGKILDVLTVKDF